MAEGITSEDAAIGYGVLVRWTAVLPSHRRPPFPYASRAETQIFYAPERCLATAPQNHEAGVPLRSTIVCLLGARPGKTSSMMTFTKRASSNVLSLRSSGGASSCSCPSCCRSGEVCRSMS